MTPPFPPRDDLLETVRDFLLRLRPTLSGELRYQAQVAAYLLDIVRLEGSEQAGAGSVGDLRAFRDAMRAGAYDDDGMLAETLLAHAVAEVRTVRPGHLDPIHREQPS